MVAAFDYCLHGKGGAAPSIDTAMHGLVDAAHVDHLHPDSGIAIATAADGEALTSDDLRRQGRVGAVAPPRLPARPRHRRDQGAEPRRRSAASSAGTASPRGATRRRRPSANSLWIIDTAAAYIAEHGKADPFGGVRAGFEALPEAERRAKAAALAPTIRGLASHDKPHGRPLHRLRRRARLPRVRERAPPRRARHELPRPLPAHQGQAAASSTCPPTATRRGVRSRACASCTRSTAPTTRRTTTRTRPPRAPRSAAPTRSSC